jgi:C-terminal processing protease CtpA/Prc
MKQLMLVCLLAASATAVAQNTAPTSGAVRVETDVVKRNGDVKRDAAEEAKTRAKLDEARARLDKAAREVAELSAELGRSARRDVFVINTGDRHAVLGVQVDDASDSRGARVLRVSPGGPAEEAGLRDGDIIVSVDDKSIAGPASGRTLVEQMRGVKPDQKVKVRVVRAGKNKDFVVVARPMAFDERMFNVRMADMPDSVAVAGAVGPMPMMQRFRAFFPGEFGGMELASLTPKLGAYFGTNEGVLVVQAPANDLFKLEDGDVIQSIDGRKPDDGAHAMRILRSYGSGEKLKLTVLRQRKPVTLEVTMPERPEFGRGEAVPFEGPMPQSIPLPPPPGMGGGTGILD